MNVMVVSLGDFNMILGNDFFAAIKVTILPHLFGLVIENEEKLCFVVGHIILIDVLSQKGVWKMVTTISTVKVDFTDGVRDAIQML